MVLKAHHRAPPSEILIQLAWGWAQESALFTRGSEHKEHRVGTESSRYWFLDL